MKNNILVGTVEEVLSFCIDTFSYQLPSQIDTIEQMQEASKLLLKISSDYSYLSNLLSQAKVYTRNMKRSGNKEAYQDAVDKQAIINNTLDATKQSYNAVSRAITVKIEINNELKMGQF